MIDSTPQRRYLLTLLYVHLAVPVSLACLTGHCDRCPTVRPCICPHHYARRSS